MSSTLLGSKKHNSFIYYYNQWTNDKGRENITW